MAIFTYERPILVIEGPAGSGKTTLFNHLTKAGFYPIERSLDLALRGYPDHKDVYLSFLKDAGMLAQALLAPETAHPMLDRFLLSQMVYGAIRRGRSRLPILTSTHLRDLVRSIWADLLLRDCQVDTYYDQVNVKPKFIFVILLPSLKQLEAQRQKSGEVYPYPANRERELYAQLAQLMTTDLNVIPLNHNEGNQDHFLQGAEDYIKSKFFELGLSYVSTNQSPQS